MIGDVGLLPCNAVSPIAIYPPNRIAIFYYFTGFCIDFQYGSKQVCDFIVNAGEKNYCIEVLIYSSMFENPVHQCRLMKHLLPRAFLATAKIKEVTHNEYRQKEFS
jgi:hypothetical protein